MCNSGMEKNPRKRTRGENWFSEEVPSQQMQGYFVSQHLPYSTSSAARVNCKHKRVRGRDRIHWNIKASVNVQFCQRKIHRFTIEKSVSSANDKKAARRFWKARHVTTAKQLNANNFSFRLRIGGTAMSWTPNWAPSQQANGSLPTMINHNLLPLFLAGAQLRVHQK